MYWLLHAAFTNPQEETNFLYEEVLGMLAQNSLTQAKVGIEAKSGAGDKMAGRINSILPQTYFKHSNL